MAGIGIGMGLGLGGGSAPASVYKFNQIAPALSSLRTGRVAFVGIGDSNQFKDGHGWDDGLSQALKRAGYNCYATELHPGMEAAYTGVSMGSAEQQNNNSNMVGLGYVSATISNSYVNDFNLNDDADANSANMAFMQYIGIPAAGTGNGLLVGLDSYSYIPGKVNYFNIQSTQVKWRLKYATYPSGSGGKFDPTIRYAATPFTQVSTTTKTTTAANSITTYEVTVDGSSVPSTQALLFSPQKVSGSNVTTPGVMGGSTTTFLTAKVGNDVTYTWTGGTDPAITSSLPATGDVINIKPQTANAGNKGRFTVINSGAGFFTITNAVGVNADAITIGTGFITNGGGPVICYNEVIDENVTAGWRHTTLFGNGGQSSYDMVLWYTTRNSNALKLYFDTINDSLSGGNCIVYIQTAANDLSEAHDSINSVSPGSGAAAYSDNITTLINAIKTTWETTCGFTASRLYFMIIPGHNLGATYTTEQSAYITAAKAIADSTPRVSVVDTRKLVSAQAMIDRAYYLGNTDKFHLRNRGYKYLTSSLLADMRLGTAPGIPSMNIASNATTAYLRKASNLTGLTDLQEGTLSFIIKPTGGTVNPTTNARILQGRDASGDIIFDLYLATSGGTIKPKLELKTTDGAAAVVTLLPVSGSGGTAGDTYNGEPLHVLFSWNTVGSLGRIYTYDVGTTGTITITASGTPALASVASWTFFADGAGSPANPFVGGIGEFWYGPTYVDFDTKANRRFFTDDAGMPKQLPDNGVVNGMTPFIYLRGDDFLTGVNRGSGGDFTLTGSLTASNTQM